MIKTQNELLLEVKENRTKKEYIPPTIEITMVEMEGNISIGSAGVAPVIDQNTNIDTDTKDYDWDPFA
ncbi:hypothetical protein [Elizabethkingia anophelis]|uniref:hypothetical protein n=1 Tax=Elizabethkingia anophelis TaxID=1117645 RepID=UPI000442C15E|nr:hypothetical protein [Elizabethkingia anophelis]MCT3663233.1 hypothetical protein [Elizabethkingia anophelis]MCT3803283.1 hypothetical protein [Elizabethkingia anophelis]MCT3906221.1 hypothetical protein [Elizabethkingia anophelis]MCT4060114.1 hypothetical protein [Elizabethkingia anophelis]MCT4070805.1 hypothetical protein [Elizabethkingia anophelis]